MRLKFLFLTLFTLSTFTLYAQNVTMAKAFFKKAQQEYEAENYEEAIKLIEKTKENLNGETNPDIIYLEAKSRFENDLNINKAKALFNQFLTDADNADSRIEEVSGILVDIETSDNYYENGQLKSKIYSVKGNTYIILYFNQNGVRTLLKKFNGNNDLEYRTVYDDNGKAKYTLGYDLNQQICSKSYFVNGNYAVQDFGSKERRFTLSNKERVVIQNARYQYLNENEYSDNELYEFTSSYFNDYLIRTATWNEWDGKDDYKIYQGQVFGGLISDIIVQEVYPNDNSVEGLGIIKKLIVLIYGVRKYIEYEFDSDGRPISRSHYTRKKLKNYFKYDFNKKQWIEKI